MKRHLATMLGVCAAAVATVLSACAGHKSSGGMVPATTAIHVRSLCPQPAGTRGVRCFATVRLDRWSPARPHATPDVGYGPPDLQRAYALPSRKKGAGQTVAIVAAYGYADAAADLAVYRSTYGLAACATATGCLKIVNQNGGTSPLPVQAGGADEWADEQAIELDMISAVCPKCHILLVETNSEDYLYQGVKTAVKLKADVVNNSYGAPEYEPSDGAFRAGHTYVAATGDLGGNNCGVTSECRAFGYAPVAAMQPASLPNVIAVGGTALTASGTQWSDSVWNEFAQTSCNFNVWPVPPVLYSEAANCGATGSGCSRIVPKPSWQTDKGCKMRAEADVVAVASNFTTVAVYATDGISIPHGWKGYGGTSVASAVVAGIVALAGNGSKANVPERIWEHGGTKAFRIVGAGNNLNAALGVRCVSKVSYVCTNAGTGYSGVAGWGAPIGVTAF